MNKQEQALEDLKKKLVELDSAIAAFQSSTQATGHRFKNYLNVNLTHRLKAAMVFMHIGEVEKSRFKVTNTGTGKQQMEPRAIEEEINVEDSVLIGDNGEDNKSKRTQRKRRKK